MCICPVKETQVQFDAADEARQKANEVEVVSVYVQLFVGLSCIVVRLCVCVCLCFSLYLFIHARILLQVVTRYAAVEAQADKLELERDTLQDQIDVSSMGRI